MSVIGRGAVQSKKAPDGYGIWIRHAPASWRQFEYPRTFASQERGTLMPTGAPRHVRQGARWEDAYARCRSVAPEAFDHDRVLNLWNGDWHAAGDPAEATSPIDGQPVAGPPMLQLEQALEAVAAANAEHQQWTNVDLDERRARVARCVDQLEAHRELLALLLVWEIGKPWRQALTSVDRTISGVRWYLEEIEPMVAGRQPLAGPVSNIASWNYPLSVLVHAMLVQLLAGNAVIAKTPTDGGLCALTLSAALMRRCDLPVTLVSGSGSRLSPALVLSDDIGCLAFVGGRDAGGQIASQLVQTDKRHMLEQEGLNAWGIWDFSDWDTLAGHLKKGFEYGKQRCTAYPRYVVQRTLFDQFLDDVPAGRPVAALRPPAGRGRPRRRAARPRLRPAHQRRQGGRATPGDRPGHPDGGDPAVPGLARARAGSCPARTPRPTCRRWPCWTRPGPAPLATPSRSARSTRSCSSTPRPSWWPR